MNNYIYFHICCINNYKDIFNNFINKIKESGLYDNIKEIRCCILGKGDISTDSKIVIRDRNENINLYETYTINLLYEDSLKEDFNVLYIHSKGITRSSKYVNDWVNYLCYFNFYHYKKCIKLLEKNDTVGVNLHHSPEIHYSGNFWWSKSEYIKKLEKSVYQHPNSPEFWLTEKNIGKYKSLWESNVNHYEEPYPEELYMDKNILEEIVDNATTDKNTTHSYLPLYQKLLISKKETAKNVLEIGIDKGGSIKLWHNFFTNAIVYGIDIMNSNDVCEDIKNKENIILYTSSNAYNTDFFTNHLLNKNIKFDLILDDGSHSLENMKQFIKLYSQIMTDDGILIIEDIEYWDWIYILKKEVPEHLKKFIKVYDLRLNKNRYDDIIFTIDKSKQHT